jgi:hypothetical protein
VRLPSYGHRSGGRRNRYQNLLMSTAFHKLTQILSNVYRWIGIV